MARGVHERSVRGPASFGLLHCGHPMGIRIHRSRRTRLSRWLRASLLLATVLVPAHADPARFASLPWDAGGARAVIVIDEETGTVLFAHNADTPHPPASITKVFAVHAALDVLLDRGIGPASLVPISADAAWYAAPPGSSLMFLEPGQQVRLDELLLGLLVSSGNDAALALAQLSHGSEQGMVAAMNRLAADLGLAATSFSDVSGLSAENRTTASDLARFLRFHREFYGPLLDPIYRAPGFVFPRPQNLAPDPSRFRIQQPIAQDSRNLLLSLLDGADGIKTGYTDASGYNLAFSVSSNDRRIIGAVLGIQAPDSLTGSRVRAEIAAGLARTALSGTRLLQPTGPPIPLPRLWLAQEDELSVNAAPWSDVVIPTGREQDLHYRSDVPTNLLAPVSRGVVLGTQSLVLDGEVIAERTVRATQSVPRSGVLGRFQDELLLIISGRSGPARPATAQ